MKKLVLVAAVFALVATALALPAIAEEDTLTATVTPCTVTNQVTDGSVDYGTVDLGDTKNTVPLDNSTNPNGGALDTQTVTNTGTCPADLMLRSSDATGTAVNWDLVACNSVGANAFGHQYEVNNASNTPGTFNGVDFPADNTNTSGLAAVAAVNGTATVDLGICMPNSTTDQGQKSITVTVVLTAQ
jgi:opacity protein-like surface antigen